VQRAQTLAVGFLVYLPVQRVTFALLEERFFGHPTLSGRDWPPYPRAHAAFPYGALLPYI